MGQKKCMDGILWVLPVKNLITFDLCPEDGKSIGPREVYRENFHGQNPETFYSYKSYCLGKTLEISDFSSVGLNILRILPVKIPSVHCV